MKIALFQGRLQKKDVRGRPKNENYVYFFVFRLGFRNMLFLSALGSTYHPKSRVNWRHNLACDEFFTNFANSLSYLLRSLIYSRAAAYFSSVSSVGHVSTSSGKNSCSSSFRFFGEVAVGLICRFTKSVHWFIQLRKRWICTAGSQKKYNRITISFVHMQFLARGKENDDRCNGGEGVGDRNGPPDTVYRCVKEGRKP